MPLPSDLITAKKAARLLGIHLGSFHRWIRKGKVRAYRMAGSRYWVRLADVEALVQAVRPRPCA